MKSCWDILREQIWLRIIHYKTVLHFIALQYNLLEKVMETLMKKDLEYSWATVKLLKNVF